ALVAVEGGADLLVGQAVVVVPHEDEAVFLVELLQALPGDLPVALADLALPLDPGGRHRLVAVAVVFLGQRQEPGALAEAIKGTPGGPLAGPGGQVAPLEV